MNVLFVHYMHVSTLRKQIMFRTYYELHYALSLYSVSTLWRSSNIVKDYVHVEPQEVVAEVSTLNEAYVTYQVLEVPQVGDIRFHVQASSSWSFLPRHLQALQYWTTRLENPSSSASLDPQLRNESEHTEKTF